MAWQTRRLEEEKLNDKRVIISVSINQEERQWLNELKETFNITNDSKALKLSALLGKNVIQTMFGGKNFKHLFKNKD